MTVHRDKFLVNKPTDALNFSFIGITTLHVLGSLSAHHQEFLAVHRLWYILCSCDEPFATRSRMELHRMFQSWCTAKNSWWWAERLPETCTVVIPIKLEFSASVGFIHKQSVTMHGHTIVNFSFQTRGVVSEQSPSLNQRSLCLVKMYSIWEFFHFHSRAHWGARWGLDCSGSGCEWISGS